MDEKLKNKINQLSPSQLKELMKKLGKSKKELPLMQRNESEEYPVSSAQRRMWFISKLNPDSFLYTNPIAIKISSKSELDIEKYFSGIKLIAQQHEILRTSFFSKKGKVFQKIHPTVPIQLNKIDLRDFDPNKKEKEVLEILKRDGQKIIDVEDYPLFRFTQISISNNESVIIYTSHHIISDAWSSTQMFRTLHGLTLNNQAIERLPELKYQYIDYVLWENTWLKGEGYQKALSEVMETIPYEPEPIDLPLDFKRPNMINYEGALEKTILNSKLVTQLKQYCKNKNLNLFHLLLATFNILLHKYSQSSEVSVGIPLANRKIKEFQETIGMFLNTLPLVTSISPEQTFFEYLLQVKTIGEKLVTHQDLPFDKLIDEINPERSLVYSPLFQVLFVYQNIPQIYEMENLRIAPVKSDYNISKYDLDLWVEEVGEEIFLSLTYQTKLFKKEAIQLFLNRYEFLLKEVITNSDKVISELKIEKATKNIAYLKYKLEYKSYLESFEEKVIANPKAIALIHGIKKTTYQVLNEKANQLAHHIISRKTGNDKIVAIALKRSENQIISILAIHKAGLAYLPIDIEQPETYIKYILEDSNVNLIITDSKHKSAFEHSTIILDKIEEDIDAYSSNNPDLQIEHEQLAYIMYTSGSTGKPKGVKISHLQLVNYSTSIWKRLSLSEDSSFASVSALTTDLGNTQIFPVFMHGASLNFIKSDLITNSTWLSNYLEMNPVDCIKMVPSHLSTLLKTENGFNILPKNLLILGGEKVNSELIIKIRNKRPNLRIINHYGPTETTIGIITHEIKEVQENSIIPIGKVLDNNCVFIVDKNSRIVPDGIKGEILICGNNVGLGYQNNKALTNKQFDQSFEHINDRCYKTGDLGRKNVDGDIEFLGRIDRQIKVRGYRVEIDAIESLILKYEGIIGCRVLIKSNSIIAYVAGNKGTMIKPNDIQNFLIGALPSYMVPDQIVIVDQIPRLGNGKVNEKQLLLINGQKQEAVSKHGKPRDEIELFILQIWQGILKLKNLSINDDFFNIGGNSLAAIEIIEIINRQFSTNLSIAVLYHNKTVAQLANLVIGAGAQRERSSIILIRKGTGSTNIFFVHPAGGNIMSYYDLSEALPEEYNVYGLQSTFANDNITTIEETATIYLKEIEDTISEGKLVFGGWSMGALIAFEMAKQFYNKNEKNIPVILLDQKAPARYDQEKTKPIGRLERLSVFGGKTDHIVGENTLLNKENLEPLSESERTALFLQEFKKYNLVPEGAQTTDFQVFLDRMMLHNDMAIDYRTKSFKGKYLLIKANDSTFVTDEFENDACYGWRFYTENEVNIKGVNGNHITIMKSPFNKEVSKAIHTFLQSALVDNLITQESAVTV
ncbi:MAG: amino acid adenylation domain-containing protein [Bacteroidia bacterium]|nr:amino acid adenylation domain-containing protein [Bacteroidia bacterium]